MENLNDYKVEDDYSDEFEQEPSSKELEDV
jgi:hypothetical protein